MSDLARAYILVSGVVQGVGFRAFTSRLAEQYGLTGWVRNTPGGEVEIEVEGERGLITGFLSELHVGPSSGHVTGIDVKWKDSREFYTDFRVIF